MNLSRMTECMRGSERNSAAKTVRSDWPLQLNEDKLRAAEQLDELDRRIKVAKVMLLVGGGGGRLRQDHPEFQFRDIWKISSGVAQMDERGIEGV